MSSEHHDSFLRARIFDSDDSRHASTIHPKTLVSRETTSTVSKEAKSDERQRPYAELHCISNFTFLRGASHPGELIHEACTLGYTALALTDECSMAGIVRAHEAAKERKFKLIIGSEFRTSDDFHVVLLAPTQEAYAQICTLISLARKDAVKGK